ncbi:MAG: hypothetical protein ACE5I7_02655 [Candidatus Binatia bacterium]
MMGRQFTLKRFVAEVLEDLIDPVMLGYIEKGQRLPSAAVVRRLAEARRQRPDALLAILARDRWLRAFERELGVILKGGKGEEGAALFTHAVSRSMAALPAGGTWVKTATWRAKLRRTLGATRSLLDTVVQALADQGLIEERGGQVRRKGQHFVAATPDERHALAMEYAAIFAKGLLDKLVLADGRTYVRNHYLDLPADALPEFQRALDTALRGLIERFATAQSRSTRFVKVLVTSTPFEEES